ncbi:MAG: aminodeoxychorismate/anthranilate synthase component II [Chloroflexi bacterium 13_1_40CM_4_68_4]|nr:MAG: aminodeoxychorismate/anthranilate synthase component II [Chloroflexi bacterium 13_1_40CM_4_68_4]
MRVLVIDNYDSFTYNLVQLAGSLGAEVVVRRNDEATPDELRALRPDRVIVSPGPGDPREAGVSCEAIRSFTADGVPTLGVCLGHQCIGAALGARIVRAPTLLHGKTSPVTHDGQGIFRGIASPTVATRYHSLAIDEATLPVDLAVTARSDDGVVMGVRHRTLPLEGVQFHPESILTADGERMMRNFLGAGERAPVRAAP